MGMNPDNGDVVDNHGRVYGVNGLRILDSSIFPELTHGNPTAPSMMVGLRGAELILSEEKDKAGGKEAVLVSEDGAGGDASGSAFITSSFSLVFSIVLVIMKLI